MKTDKEKAKEILKKRDRARKGFAETNDEGKDPLAEQDRREDRVADSGLIVGLGMKRS